MVGQHIRILKGGRWVHAVDCGDETVLHLVDEAPPPRVRRAYRPEFVAGADAVEVVTHRERTFPAKEIVKRAYSRASDPALAAMFRDSESFVEWCTTGRLAGARNVALDVPGFVAVAAAAPAPAARNGKAAAPAKQAAKPKAVVKAAPKAKAVAKPAKKKAAVKAKAAKKSAPKVKAKGGGKAAKAKASVKKVAAKRAAPKKKKGRR